MLWAYALGQLGRVQLPDKRVSLGLDNVLLCEINDVLYSCVDNVLLCEINDFLYSSVEYVLLCE